MGQEHPQAVPNRRSSQGLSPRQFAKRVGVTFHMAQFIVFGRDYQHQPSGFQRKTSIHHSILTTTCQETIRPQAKPQGRKSEPCTRIRPSHTITELLNKKRPTQAKKTEHPQPCKRHVWSLQRDNTSTSSLSRNAANKASPSSKMTMHQRQSLHLRCRTLGPGWTHVLGVHRSKWKAFWKRPIAQVKPSERLLCLIQVDNLYVQKDALKRIRMWKNLENTLRVEQLPLWKCMEMWQHKPAFYLSRPSAK